MTPSSESPIELAPMPAAAAREVLEVRTHGYDVAVLWVPGPGTGPFVIVAGSGDGEPVVGEAPRPLGFTAAWALACQLAGAVAAVDPDALDIDRALGVVRTVSPWVLERRPAVARVGDA